MIYLESLYHQIKYNFNSISFLFAASSWGCQYTSNILNITCQQHQHIYILKSVLRRSYTSCRTKRTCCSTDCGMYGSLQRVQQLKNLCDGRQQCQVNVTTEECTYRSRYYGYTDNELVRYFCINTTPGKLELGIAILKYTIDLIKIRQRVCESV